MSLRVLCLANSSVNDGGVGPAVARELRQSELNLEVVEATTVSANALNAVADCDRLVVIDTLTSGAGAPGTILEFNEGEKQYYAGQSPRYVGVFDALEAARDMGIGTPSDVLVLAAVGGGIEPVPALIERIRQFASLASTNRHDNALCHTDACDVCIGQKACTDRLVVRQS